MSDQAINAPQPAPLRLGTPALSLAALGVVFGDIGTSPLYTLKTVLDVTGAHPGSAARQAEKRRILTTRLSYLWQ